MDILYNAGIVFLGGLVLYYGAEWLVDGASGIARKFGIKEIVVGLTVVALGTSAPELAVSISANLSGTSPVVFGNVIGSCIANLALILGLTALVAPLPVEAGLLRRELPILIASAVALPIMLSSGGGVSRVEGITLLVAFGAYTATTLFFARPTIVMAQDAGTADEDDDDDDDSSTGMLIGLTVVGLVLLISGGELFVRGAKAIALDLGMSERVVGLTIVAFGTSVPELAASLSAARKGKMGLAIGNVIGSNISNIFLVVGASATIQALPGDLTSQLFDFGFMGGVTLFAVVAMRKARTIGRIEGTILTLAYCTFIVLTTIL